MKCDCTTYHYIWFAISGVLCAIAFWVAKPGRDLDLWLRIFTCYICCAFIFGLGFPLQDAVEEILGVNPSAWATIYYIEYELGYFFKSFLFEMLAGLAPGSILFILFTLNKNNSPIKAAIFGAISLTICDLINYGLRFLLSASYYQSIENLSFSIFCNVIGGGFAGLICRVIYKKISLQARNKKVSLVRIWQNICAYTGGAFLILIIGYFCVFHTQTATVILEVTKSPSFSIKYKENDLLEVKAGSILEKIQNNNYWERNPPEIMADGFVSSINISTNSNIIASLYGYVACNPKELEQKIKTLDQNPYGAEITIENKIALNGLSQIGTFQISSKEGELWLNKKAVIRVNNSLEKDKINYIVSGEGEFVLPVAKGDAIVLKALPKFPFDGPSPIDIKTFNDLDHVKLQINSAEPRFTLPPGVGENSCRNINFQVPPKLSDEIIWKEKLQHSSYLLKIKDAPNNAKLIINLNGAQFSLPKKEKLDLKEYTEQIKIDLGSGALTIGATRIELHPTDSIFIRGDLKVSEKDDVILVKGSSRYVLLNDKLQSINLWPSLKEFLFNPLFAFLGSLAVIWYNKTLKKWLMILFKP